MIRRDCPDGDPPRWILIRQIDHAHLAGKLAEHWGAAPFAPLVARDELLWAIRHHDDGWRDWDATPDVDPQSGRPRSFTEMQAADSVEIWSASIETARGAGNLQAFVVAAHFCALARRAIGSRREAAEANVIDDFLSRYKTESATWLSNWQARNPALNTPERAQLALAQLQFFDLLSLWFCCAARARPERLQPPGGPTLTLQPFDADQVLCSPWPLETDRLNLEVEGRAVIVGRFSSRDELAAAHQQSSVLRWQLVPGAPNR
jgi:uncharacterized protein DUF3891